MRSSSLLSTINGTLAPRQALESKALSIAEPIDADGWAGAFPAAIAGQRNVIGIDRIKDADGTAQRWGKTRDRRTLRQERTFERAIRPASGAGGFVSNHDVANALRSKTVERRQLEVVKGELANRVSGFESVVEEGRDVWVGRPVTVFAARHHGKVMRRPGQIRYGRAFAGRDVLCQPVVGQRPRIGLLDQQVVAHVVDERWCDDENHD